MMKFHSHHVCSSSSIARFGAKNGCGGGEIIIQFGAKIGADRAVGLAKVISNQPQEVAARVTLIHGAAIAFNLLHHVLRKTRTALRNSAQHQFSFKTLFPVHVHVRQTASTVSPLSFVFAQRP